MYISNLSPISKVVDILIDFDKQSVPECMFLQSEELEVLRSSDAGFAITFEDTRKNIIAAAYALPALEVADLLRETDQKFEAKEQELYIYSVVVHPNNVGNGLGQKVLSCLMFKAKAANYKFASLHARKAHGWDKTVEETISPYEKRTVEDFWPALEDKDVIFMRCVI